MALIDRRWKLFFWADARRAAVVLRLGFALFLVWDLVALHSSSTNAGAPSS